MRRLLLGVLAGLAAVVPIASAASAQAPPPSPPSTTPPTAPPVPAPVPTLPPAPGSEKPPTGDSLIPDAGADEYPTGNHDIGYDEGAWNSFGRKALGFFTGLGWTINRIMVGVTLWLVGWAFGFDIVGPLQGPILTIAAALNTHVAGPLQLSHFIWFSVVAYAGFQFFRGRAMSGSRRVPAVVRRPGRHDGHHRQPGRLPRRRHHDAATDVGGGDVAESGRATRRTTRRPPRSSSIRCGRRCTTC